MRGAGMRPAAVFIAALIAPIAAGAQQALAPPAPPAPLPEQVEHCVASANAIWTKLQNADQEIFLGVGDKAVLEAKLAAALARVEELEKQLAALKPLPASSPTPSATPTPAPVPTPGGS